MVLCPFILVFDVLDYWLVSRRAWGFHFLLPFKDCIDVSYFFGLWDSGLDDTFGPVVDPAVFDGAGGGRTLLQEHLDEVVRVLSVDRHVVATTLTASNTEGHLVLKFVRFGANIELLLALSVSLL